MGSRSGPVLSPAFHFTMAPSTKEDASLEKGSVEVTEKVVLEFGGDSSLPPPPVLTTEEEKRLYRKVDLRLMPMLSLMYLCSFLDRGTSLLKLINKPIVKRAQISR